MAFTGQRKALVFAFLIQLSRCYWVYGNPYLYDKDLLIPVSQSKSLAFKYWGILGSLLIMLVKGKVRQDHDQIDLVGHSTRYGANRHESLRNAIKGRNLNEITSGEILRSST